MNATKAGDWKTAIHKTVQLWGKFDILVNWNIGISYMNKRTHEVTEDESEKVIAVNVKSVFLDSNAFIIQAEK
ncbi:unnamed protein product, partial [Clonostachys byssicola]